VTRAALSRHRNESPFIVWKFSSRIFDMSFFSVAPSRDQALAECFGVGVSKVSGRSNRYVVGSWLADKLMAVLWFYLVLRGVGRRRRSAPK
jgi:hypothetical protein